MQDRFALSEILKGRGLFVYSDPGGAKPMLSLATDKKINTGESFVISDREYPFSSSFSVEPRKPNIDPSIDIEKIKPDYVFTGISYTSKLELNYISQANIHKIPSYSFIDHWVNIRPRFLKDGLEVFPQIIFVQDFRAKELAILDGLPKEKIETIDNPYHHYLKYWQPPKNRSQTLEEFGIQSDHRRICLYAPDPLSNLEINKRHGFDEVSATNSLVECLKQSNEKFQLILAPHPNQDLNMFSEKIKSAFTILPPGKDLNGLIYYSDFIIGFYSSLLIEAELLGKAVLRFLPSRENDQLDHKNIGTIVDKSTILSFLS